MTCAVTESAIAWGISNQSLAIYAMCRLNLFRKTCLPTNSAHSLFLCELCTWHNVVWCVCVFVSYKEKLHVLNVAQHVVDPNTLCDLAITTFSLSPSFHFLSSSGSFTTVHYNRLCSVYIHLVCVWMLHLYIYMKIDDWNGICYRIPIEKHWLHRITSPLLLRVFRYSSDNLMCDSSFIPNDKTLNNLWHINEQEPNGVVRDREQLVSKTHWI